MIDKTDTEQPFTVYYDGACPLGRKEIDTYRKINGAEQLNWMDAADCCVRTVRCERGSSVWET